MAFLRRGKFLQFYAAGKNLFNFRKLEFAQSAILKNFATVRAVAVKSDKRSDTLNTLLRRLDNEVRRSGRISTRYMEKILEDIRTNKSATSSQSLLVIKCFGSLVPEVLPEVRTKMVQQIWESLSKMNVPMDISHYNALLKVYIENEYKFSPTEFLADLQAKGIEPNRVTYQRIISSYCQQGDISEATQILEFMREKKLPVNEVVFNALIIGHSNCADLESAAGILGFMTQAGLHPSSESYTNLLCGFARVGDEKSINKFIEQSEHDEISLLDKDFLEVIYNLAVNGHEAKVDELLQRLKQNYGYNQDVINVSLRLINRGQESTALKLVRTMHQENRTTGEKTDSGDFLIRQLIKINRPVEQILKICEELEESGLHSKPLLIALNTALSIGQVETSKILLKELSRKGFEMRHHYFWPFFCKAKSVKEVVDIFKMMENDFKMSPNDQTLRDYVIPKMIKMKNADYESVIQTLFSCGVSPGRAAAASALVAISNNQLAKAAEIMSHYDSYYAPRLFSIYLTKALHHSYDFTSYIKIIRSIVENLDKSKTKKSRLESREHETEDGEENLSTEASETSSGSKQLMRDMQADVVSDLLFEALLYFKSNRIEVAGKILRGLVDQGLSINSHKAKIIRNRFGEELTDELLMLLDKLASGELEPIPVESEKSNFPTRSSKNSEQTPEKYERLISKITEKGGKTNALKRQWLLSVIRSKNVSKAEEIFSQLKSEGYVMRTGAYAQMIELYASEDRPDDALKMLNVLRETNPELVLDEVKMIRVMQSLVNAGRIDEAIKFVEQNKTKEAKDEKSLKHQDTCWRLLNSLAEKGKVEQLNKLFEALVASGYIFPNNVLLGPLIKVHLIQNDVKSALEKFEELSQKYRATPWRNEIASRLIQSEDGVNLQRLVDLNTKIHGESNSLYDLVFTFIECGRIRLARKIFETPRLQRGENRIKFACERYLNENMPKALEGLFEVTKGLSHIDRANIYQTLLKTYIKESAPEKALKLWTTMQEENVAPSDIFLIELADFLKANKLEVPFHVPSSQKVETEQEVPAKKKINEADVEVANKLERENFLKKSEEIESLVKADNLKEATKLIFEMLNEKSYPLLRIFSFYLKKLATSGDSATLEKLSQILSPEMKKKLLFENRVCYSFVSCGKVEEYLDKFERFIDDAKTPEDLKTIDEIFPKGGTFGLLESNPELAPKFEQIAMKYADKQIFGPVNVLWTHYFIQNDSRADDIFKRYFTDSSGLFFKNILNKARVAQDEALVQRLIQNLSKSKVSKRSIGIVYSCLIDVHSAKGNADACLSTITDCIKEVGLRNIHRSTLLNAKDCVEKAGQKFPHIIQD